MAALASGHVYNPGGHPVPNQTLVVYNANGKPTDRQFATDNSGSYGIYLQPGEYIMRAANNAYQEGRITSHPQPVDQDIHLHAT